MLKNAYLLAKIGADTAENERHFAENLPKIGNYFTGRARAHEVRRPHGAALRGGAGPAVRRQAGKTKKSPFTSLSFTFVSI